MNEHAAYVPLLLRVPDRVDPEDQVAVGAWLVEVLDALQRSGHLAMLDQRVPRSERVN
jgi:hypothetical protein